MTDSELAKICQQSHMSVTGHNMSLKDPPIHPEKLPCNTVAKEAVWVHMFLPEIAHPLKYPVILLLDNKSASLVTVRMLVHCTYSTRS